jgi:hypothetical protein
MTHNENKRRSLVTYQMMPKHRHWPNSLSDLPIMTIGANGKMDEAAFMT